MPKTKAQPITWRWLEEELVKRLVSEAKQIRRKSLKPFSTLIERRLKSKGGNGDARHS